MRPAPAAQAAEGDDDNAALAYWQAFGLVPRLTDEQEKLLAAGPGEPIDAEAAAKLVESAQGALRHLHRGAERSECDWALEWSAGPEMLMPHLSKARELAKLACLRARLRIDRNEHAAAVEDLGAVLVLGRHVGADPTMLSRLVGHLIERLAIDLAASRAPALDPAARRELAARIGRLPVFAPTADVWRAEQRFFLDWLVARLRAAESAPDDGKADEAWKRDVRALLGAEEAAKVTLPASPGAMLRSIDPLIRLYDQLAAVDDARPAAEFDRTSTELWQAAMRGAADRELSAALTPNVPMALAKLRQGEVRLAMLRAALAVLDGGEAQLKSVEDPFAGGPFAYVKNDNGGFELKSKLEVEGKPVTLRVGPPESKE